MDHELVIGMGMGIMATAWKLVQAGSIRGEESADVIVQTSADGSLFKADISFQVKCTSSLKSLSCFQTQLAAFFFYSPPNLEKYSWKKEFCVEVARNNTMEIHVLRNEEQLYFSYFNTTTF